jgi:hypothetical protein
MHMLSLHNVTSVRMGEVQQGTADVGYPYATRKLVVGTADGAVEITLFSRTDSALPDVEKTPDAAAAALFIRKL